MKKSRAAILIASTLMAALLMPAVVHGDEAKPVVTVTTNQTSYSADASVDAKIQIENGTPRDLNIISLSGKIPTGFTVEGSDGTTWVLAEGDSISSGTSKTYGLKLKNKNEGAANNATGANVAKTASVKDSAKDASKAVKPVKTVKTAKTGDSSWLIVSLVLMICAAGGIAVILRSKKARKAATVLLVTSLAGAGLLASGTVVKAAANQSTKKTVTSSAEIKVGDQVITISVSLDYDEVSNSTNEGTAASKGNDLSYDGYNLVFDDEFDGGQLDKSVWNVETHEPGYVNAEWQKYVDSSENIHVDDGKLVLESKGTTKDSITSGRINTQGKFDFKYGIAEVSAIVPEGEGFLPAFWLMPTNENLYGQWPRCGEIDAMEVMGKESDLLYGTLHFGNPHSQSQGTYRLPSGQRFSAGYHKFTVEWMPGKIIWYVDGVKYHEESDWYSTTVGAGTASYPAPFDQNFYLILNLAVGNEWAGAPSDVTTVDGKQFKIDYVRVYQKDSYDENVTKPEKKVVLRDPDADGNYIINGNFAEKESLTDDYAWKFLTTLGGEATADIDNNQIDIKTSNEGTVDYSVQLVQAGIPLKKGATYEVSFDAKASSNRTMGVGVKAPDRGYTAYMPVQNVNLTSQYQNYKFEFTMTEDSDANGRLEYEMGACGSAADIDITNVRLVKKSEMTDEEMNKKTVLSTGNYVYNGGFNEGANRLAYWEISDADAAKLSVTSEGKDGTGHRLAVAGSASLGESALAIKPNEKYELSFEGQTEGSATVELTINGEKFTQELTKENQKAKFTFATGEQLVNSDLVIKVTGEGRNYIDNVVLQEDALVKNGAFKSDLAGWEAYIASDAKASYVVDYQKEDGAISFTIDDTADQDYKVQLKQTGVTLENGHYYKLTFKAKSSIDREIRGIMQGGKALEYPVYSGENIVSVGNQYQEYTKYFQMDAATDNDAFISFCLGMVNGRRITEKHTVCIDDISLAEITADEMPAVKIPADDAILKNTSFAKDGSGKITPWNTMLNGGQATFDAKDGALTVDISDVGTANYAVQVKQENVTLEKGAVYRVTCKIESSVKRKIMIATLSSLNGWYDGKTIDLEPGTNDIDITLNMSGMAKAVDTTAYFTFSLGKADKVDTPAGVLTIKNLKFEKISGSTGAEVDSGKTEPGKTEPGVDDTNSEVVQNTAFEVDADNKLTGGWMNLTAEGGAGYYEKNEDGSLTYHVTSVGSVNYGAQLKQEGITLVKGQEYEVDVDVTSSVDRSIIMIFQGGEARGYKAYSVDYVGTNNGVYALTAGKTLHIHKTFTMKEETDTNVGFAFSMGQSDDGSATPAGDITFNNLKVRFKGAASVDDSLPTDATKDPAEAPSADPVTDPTPAAGSDESNSQDTPVADPAADDTTASGPVMLVRPGDITGFWSNANTDAAADITEITGGYQFMITAPGTQDYYIQMSKSGLNLKAGKTYTFTFKALSDTATSIRSNVTNGVTYYPDYTEGAYVTLEPGVEKEVTYSFTMTQDDAGGVFYVNLGKSATGTVQLYNISIMEN